VDKGYPSLEMALEGRAEYPGIIEGAAVVDTIYA
jgi:hypothetical protein